LNKHRIFVRCLRIQSYPDEPTIVLTSLTTRVQQLEVKLLEYSGRIREFSEMPGSFTALDTPQRRHAFSTTVKAGVLGTLLREGEVRAWSLSAKMFDKFGPDLSAFVFDRACDVINDYNATGGQNCDGGTGLPPIG